MKLMKFSRALSLLVVVGAQWSCGGGAVESNGDGAQRDNDADVESDGSTGSPLPEADASGGGSSDSGSASSDAGSVRNDAGAGSSDAGASSDGGSSQDAGSGSSDASTDPPGPHTVMPCPSGASEVGKWTHITPPGVSLTNGDLGVNAFVFDPSNTATVYVGTYEQGIYKSTDCGATWKKINTGKNGDEIGTGRNWTMAIDPQEPQTLYANAGYGPMGLFKSVNGGVDWDQLFPEDSDFSRYADAFVETVAIDPTNHKHLVVHSHSECTGPVAGSTCYAESLDSGATWRVVKAFPGTGYEAVGTAILGGGTWLTFEPFDGIILTENSGASWRKAYDGSAANQMGSLYRHGDGNYYVASYDGVLKSTDGLKWSLIPNSPRSFSLAGDGTTIWTSVQDADESSLYQYAAGDLTQWKTYPSPKIKKGAWFMKYDKDHNLLYTSNEDGGLWRVKTK